MCVCAADEVQSVKTAVSHGDRTLSEVTLMTLLLKCEARVITVQSLKARAVTAAENTRQSRAPVVERSLRGCWSSQIQSMTPTAQASHVVPIDLCRRRIGPTWKFSCAPFGFRSHISH